MPDTGTDDFTFAREWGDSSPSTTSTHPNGGTFPFAATDEEIHVNATAGTYEVKLTTTDDDGGAAEILITVSY